ncbi:DNA helicase [Tanacetum coccineum]
MQEAVGTATPAELQTLFAHILTFCHVMDPVSLWGRVWRSMSKDLPYTSSISLNIPNLHIHDSQLEDYVLYELEGCLNHCSRSLTYFGLRLPPEDLMSVLRNRLLMEEKCYKQELLAKEKDRLKGQKVATFAKWLLDIRNGSLGNPDESDLENTSWIDIPDNHRIPDDENGIINLIRFIYDDDTLQNPTPQKL